MLEQAKKILGKKIHATDGEVGKVKDIFFDDWSWNIRYLVVDTGGWLDRHEVLLVPEVFLTSDLNLPHFDVNFTRQQVEESPPVMSDMPLSRIYEERLHDHYGWTPYWTAPLYPYPGLQIYGSPSEPDAADPALLPREAQEAYQQAIDNADPNLRSFKEIKGYKIHATDGEIGEVKDALIDLKRWHISHFIVDTRTWLPGGNVVIDTGVISEFDWTENEVVVRMSQDAVKNAPKYDESMKIDLSYESQLTGYYQEYSSEQFSRTSPHAPSDQRHQRRPDDSRLDF